MLAGNSPFTPTPSTWSPWTLSSYWKILIFRFMITAHPLLCLHLCSSSANFLGKLFQYCRTYSCEHYKHIIPTYLALMLVFTKMHKILDHFFHFLNILVSRRRSDKLLPPSACASLASPPSWSSSSLSLAASAVSSSLCSHLTSPTLG